MTGKIVMKLFKIIIVILFIHVINGFSCPAVDQAFEEKRVAITKAFKVAFDVSLPDKFEPLAGGFSSPGIYRVLINGKSYVLRLSHPKRTLKDEQRTISCIEISSKMGLSPKLYYASAEDGIVIMDYIEPKLLSWKELTVPKNLKQLALTLQKLHVGPRFPEFVTVFDVKRMFERVLGNHKPKLLEELDASLAEIETLLRKNKVGHPCHNDLKLDNLLFDGKQFWLVDWEGASQGNPFFDIATVITFLAMNADQEDYFLESYFGKKPTDFQRSQLGFMKQVVLSYYGTAYLMIAKIRYQLPPASQDNLALPDAALFIRNHIKNSSSSISSENIQKFGIVLLNQAFNNIRSMGKQ
jgi:thiamine kinase-like enzyme